MLPNPGGYLHPEYAASLEFCGQPWALDRSGGWLLRRSIPGTPYFDAMGCYPLFTCRQWDQLPADMANLPPDWVCVTAVTDPLAAFDEETIRQSFPDICYPYKEHMLVDLSEPMVTFVDPHHRRYARWALKRVQVDLCPTPGAELDTWCRLYHNLRKRHAITGIARFSRSAFQYQLSLPGVVVFKATINHETVSMLIWYRMGSRAYYHLGASTAAGYQARASFALFWESFNYFTAQGVHWINLGSGPGWQSHCDNGLTRFKRGWSNARKPSYFCGRIIDRQTYRKLDQATETAPFDFFPRYRFADWNGNDHHFTD